MSKKRAVFVDFLREIDIWFLFFGKRSLICFTPIQKDFWGIYLIGESRGEDVLRRLPSASIYER